MQKLALSTNQSVNQLTTFFSIHYCVKIKRTILQIIGNVYYFKFFTGVKGVFFATLSVSGLTVNNPAAQCIRWYRSTDRYYQVTSMILT
jgi:hypothetical protein